MHQLGPDPELCKLSRIGSNELRGKAGSNCRGVARLDSYKCRNGQRDITAVGELKDGCLSPMRQPLETLDPLAVRPNLLSKTW
jgi:hypothetical protein